VAKLFRAEVAQLVESRGSVVEGKRLSRRQATTSSFSSYRSDTSLKPLAKIQVASSTNLPLKSRSIAAICSSPPYCTRIDYAVATAPELAVLGIGGFAYRELRAKMIGSSMVTHKEPEPTFMWGSRCCRFLERVATHPSKASATYYLRNHLQYFDGIVRSLAELDRILVRGAPCVLVIQDSYYKDIHNNLPAIVEEMGQALGWSLVARYNYLSKRHMGRVNRYAAQFYRPRAAAESVLIFETSR
jgi:hypothetical protein